MMSPPRRSTLRRSPRCASLWKRWARAQLELFSKVSSRCSKNARSPPATAKWLRSWWFGSPLAAFNKGDVGAAITVLHECEPFCEYHVRVFLLTGDVEKTHYSYDLISGLGIAVDPPLPGMLKQVTRRAADARHGLMKTSAALPPQKGRSRTMKSHRVTLPIMLLVLTFCAASWAQDTASLTGTVTDPSGAAIAGAQVAINNAEQGISRKAASNGSGDFLFAALPIGKYDVVVTATGFKKYQAKGVVLNVAEKARVYVSMGGGSGPSEVTVERTQVAPGTTHYPELGVTLTYNQ